MPSFPVKVLQMALPSYSFEDFSHTLIDILSLTKKRVETNHTTTTLGKYAFELWNIRELIRQYINSDPYSYLTLTIPIWFLDEHSNKLRERIASKDIQGMEVLVDMVISKANIKFHHEITLMKSYFQR